MHSRRKLIPKPVADSVIGKFCPICLNRLEIRSAAVVVSCMHSYCIQCIRRWSNLKRNCPLCNANFSSWFCKINLSDDTFSEQKLLPAKGGKTVHSPVRDDLLRRRRAQFFERKRMLLRLIRESRQESSAQSQTRQLPIRRSFGQTNHEGFDIIAESVKQWRASIYEKQLKAVPLSSKNGLMQQILGNTGAKEIILRRIEPWIKRELQAVLGDPDPTVIVHVVTSLFILRHERKRESIPDQVGVEDDFLAPLRPFLHEHTDIFWHELCCFSESSFSMEAYDKVVEYN